MAERAAILERIVSGGLVAIIRADSSDGLIETCRALAAGGVKVAEITMTTPNAIAAIREASAALPDMLMGVGSVVDGPTVKEAVAAGAEFVVSPVFKAEVVEASHALGKPVLAGAFTPTEILAATEAGADLVKVFPANHNGPKFFKDVLAPMPHLNLTPTGGVDLTTLEDWFAAGAKCVGVGSALVKKDLIKAAAWGELTALAEQFVAKVAAIRGAIRGA
ncbi:MAG: bifunctional 4-hydroxy-2-oxoglutarate aldolase/2-dehydro-3-deoxy-phosphogluconate aldolase [Planctomycetota bacterium]